MGTVRIKEARKLAGLTQQELADALGMPVTTLSGYETGRYMLKSDLLVPISRACNVSIDFLLGVTLINKPPAPPEPEPEPELEPEPEDDDAGGDEIREALISVLRNAGLIGEGGDISGDDFRFLSTIVAALAAWFQDEGQG